MLQHDEGYLKKERSHNNFNSQGFHICARLSKSKVHNSNELVLL